MEQPLRVTDDGAGMLLIELFGDIDMNTSGPVQAGVEEAFTRAQPKFVQVDLDSVQFLDSSGIAVLVVGHRLAEAAGAQYRVVNVAPGIYEHFRMTGLLDVFGVASPTTESSASG
jgi:anti-anti-sigma factor